MRVELAEPHSSVRRDIDPVWYRPWRAGFWSRQLIIQIIRRPYRPGQHAQRQRLSIAEGGQMILMHLAAGRIDHSYLVADRERVPHAPLAIDSHRVRIQPFPLRENRPVRRGWIEMRHLVAEAESYPDGAVGSELK